MTINWGANHWANLGICIWPLFSNCFAITRIFCKVQHMRCWCMVIISHLTKVISNVKCNRVKTGIFIVLVSSYIIIFPYCRSLREKSYWLVDPRHRLLQQCNLIAKLIQLKLFGLFLGTPDTSLLKPPPEPLPQRDVLGSMRSWNSLSFLPISSDISGSRRSAADSSILALMNSSKQPTLRFSQFKACSLIQWNCNWRHTRCKGLLQQQRQKSGTSAMS